MVYSGAGRGTEVATPDSVHESGEVLNGVALGTGEEVAVGVEGEGDAGVPHHGLDHLRLDATHGQPGSAGVAERVEVEGVPSGVGRSQEAVAMRAGPIIEMKLQRMAEIAAEQFGEPLVVGDGERQPPGEACGQAAGDPLLGVLAVLREAAGEQDVVGMQVGRSDGQEFARAKPGLDGGFVEQRMLGLREVPPFRWSQEAACQATVRVEAGLLAGSQRVNRQGFAGCNQPGGESLRARQIVGLGSKRQWLPRLVMDQIPHRCFDPVLGDLLGLSPAVRLDDGSQPRLRRLQVFWR